MVEPFTSHRATYVLHAVRTASSLSAVEKHPPGQQISCALSSFSRSGCPSFCCRSNELSAPINRVGQRLTTGSGSLLSFVSHPLGTPVDSQSLYPANIEFSPDSVVVEFPLGCVCFVG
jgi:hypothetical protein